MALTPATFLKSLIAFSTLNVLKMLKFATDGIKLTTLLVRKDGLAVSASSKEKNRDEPVDIEDKVDYVPTVGNVCFEANSKYFDEHFYPEDEHED